MRTAFFEYSRERTSKEIYESLDKEEKKILDDFRDYMLISASQKRCDEARREVLRFREVIGKNFEDIDLEDLRYFLKQVKEYELADYTKNKVKAFVHRFLKWKYKNWSERFDNFEDVKYNNDAQRKKPITSKTILTEEEIEKLIEHEKSLFFKAFLKVQYVGGLRTGEVRALEWERITFNDKGVCSIKVISKKNRNATDKERIIPLSKGANYFLLELKKQQKNNFIETKWVFPSPKNPNKHISKSVNEWFRKLTKEVLGREVTNYTLRHTQATKLKTLVKENKLSKENAVEFLGHSEEMFDKIYSHMDKEDNLKIMREQIYGVKELTEEEEHELKKKVKEQDSIISDLSKQMQEMKAWIMRDSEKRLDRIDKFTSP
jgi:integrase